MRSQFRSHDVRRLAPSLETHQKPTTLATAHSPRSRRRATRGIHRRSVRCSSPWLVCCSRPRGLVTAEAGNDHRMDSVFLQNVWGRRGRSSLSASRRPQEKRCNDLAHKPATVRACRLSARRAGQGSTESRIIDAACRRSGAWRHVRKRQKTKISKNAELVAALCAWQVTVLCSARRPRASLAPMSRLTISWSCCGLWMRVYDLVRRVRHT